MPWSLSGLWFKSARKHIIVGDGYYSTGDIAKSWRRDTSFPWLYRHSIKGEDHNSIALCGYSLISYFNGVRWNSLEIVEQPKYTNVDIKGNIIVAVGAKNSQGVITIGKR